ncbi:MAG: 3'-5' exonuclease [Sneathiella sp.]
MSKQKMNSIEREELKCLASCLKSIEDNLQVMETRLSDHAREIRETTEHMWEARRDMDHIDKVALRQTIDQKTRSAEVLHEQKQKLLKLRKSPYFGRFDFIRDEDADAVSTPVYVGVHDLRDEQTGKSIAYDWRAPIASMFYDYEIGPARYEAPSGDIYGQLELKRQFRIRDSRMEFVLESGVNIVDDVLQEELSRASDEGMKNIVSTIQRDQNAIIRNGDAHSLIIQGVAGSGKTSIALHRIAFLLYRFKDTLSSNDILIISPNRVFADYIGNVLPELGEEQIAEVGMETLADELLEGKFSFQTFFEQTSLLLEKNDEALKARISAKSTLAFLKQIDAYLEHMDAHSFQAMDWRSGRNIIPAWHFEESWQKYRKLPTKERIAEVISLTEHQFFMHYRRELLPEERRDLRKTIRGMVRQTTLLAAYKGLFEWMDRPELFKRGKATLEYADVFPLIYLKMHREGVHNPRGDVKHLLIDEMQDYTSVQYAVLNRLFPCRKTILGDATQTVNPYGASTAAQIQEVLRASAPVKLVKSYRSSWEIMQFALGVSPNDELIPIERHGDVPRIIISKSAQEQAEQISVEIREFEASDHRSLAIIAKTQKQAEKLHEVLKKNGIDAQLLNPDSVGFSSGVIVCTVHLAKGLEFDRVIVSDVTAQNYHTELDRNLLYIACTRAMHKLSVIAVNTPSKLLP